MRPKNSQSLSNISVIKTAPITIPEAGRQKLSQSYDALSREGSLFSMEDDKNSVYYESDEEIPSEASPPLPPFVQETIFDTIYENSFYTQALRGKDEKSQALHREMAKEVFKILKSLAEKSDKWIKCRGNPAISEDQLLKNLLAENMKDSEILSTFLKAWQDEEKSSPEKISMVLSLRDFIIRVAEHIEKHYAEYYFTAGDSSDELLLNCSEKYVRGIHLKKLIKEFLPPVKYDVSNAGASSIRIHIDACKFTLISANPEHRTKDLVAISRESGGYPLLMKKGLMLSIFGRVGDSWKITELETRAYQNIPDHQGDQNLVLETREISEELRREIILKNAHTPLKTAPLETCVGFFQLGSLNVSTRLALKHLSAEMGVPDLFSPSIPIRLFPSDFLRSEKIDFGSIERISSRGKTTIKKRIFSMKEFKRELKNPHPRAQQTFLLGNFQADGPALDRQFVNLETPKLLSIISISLLLHLRNIKAVDMRQASIINVERPLIPGNEDQNLPRTDFRLIAKVFNQRPDLLEWQNLCDFLTGLHEKKFEDLLKNMNAFKLEDTLENYKVSQESTFFFEKIDKNKEPELYQYGQLKFCENMIFSQEQIELFVRNLENLKNIVSEFSSRLEAPSILELMLAFDPVWVRRFIAFKLFREASDDLRKALFPGEAFLLDTAEKDRAYRRGNDKSAEYAGMAINVPPGFSGRTLSQEQQSECQKILCSSLTNEELIKVLDPNIKFETPTKSSQSPAPSPPSLRSRKGSFFDDFIGERQSPTASHSAVSPVRTKPEKKPSFFRNLFSFSSSDDEAPAPDSALTRKKSLEREEKGSPVPKSGD